MLFDRLMLAPLAAPVAVLFRAQGSDRWYGVPQGQPQRLCPHCGAGLCDCAGLHAGRLWMLALPRPIGVEQAAAYEAAEPDAAARLVHGWLRGRQESVHVG